MNILGLVLGTKVINTLMRGSHIISQGITVDSTDKEDEDDLQIPSKNLGYINMDDVSLDDNTPQNPQPQEGQTSQEGPLD